MAISIVDKFEFNILETATTLKIPPNVLKLIIQKLFGMQAWLLIPNTVSFIEIDKAYLPTEEPNGEVFQINREGPLLINGQDTMIIGLTDEQGTDYNSTLDYLCKAAKTVFDLTPWYETMDVRLK